MKKIFLVIICLSYILSGVLYSSSHIGWGKGTVTEFNTFNDDVKSALGIPSADGKRTEFSELIEHPEPATTDVIWAVEDTCPVELRPTTMYSQEEVQALGYIPEVD